MFWLRPLFGRVFHELTNAVWRSHIVSQPLDLPLSDTITFFWNVMPSLRFVYPLKLANQHQGRLRSWRFPRERFGWLILCKCDKVVLVAVKWLGALIGMKPNSILKHLVIKITCA